jgi:hypothetical protein
MWLCWYIGTPWQPIFQPQAYHSWLENPPTNDVFFLLQGYVRLPEGTHTNIYITIIIIK